MQVISCPSSAPSVLVWRTDERAIQRMAASGMVDAEFRTLEQASPKLELLNRFLEETGRDKHHWWHRAAPQHEPDSQG